MKCLIIPAVLFLFMLFNSILYAQDTAKIIIAAGEEYKAGTLHKIFFGELWREAWVTPVEAPIIDLQSFAGGLRPVKKGGGYQTKTLRFKGNDGKEYKFRSLNKDPRKVLPPELQQTFVAEVLKDQISTSNPYAPLITTPILNKMGILQAEPTLVYLPDTELLGEFRSEFANLLGTIEEHPEEGFANSLKVKGTFDLFDEMEEDNDNIVDAADYLKVRLVDMYIGDWDRHTDQWRWAAYDEGNKRVWKPIPRDRDQAFARFDGIFPWMTAIAVTQLEGFSGTFPEIEDLTWSGRYLDRRLLTSLTKVEWDSVTSFVLERLTDTLILTAVNRLPREVFAIEGDRLVFTLIQRRNRLRKASDEFYRHIFKYVEIRGSNKREYAEINRINDDTVTVSLFKRDKETGMPKGKLLYYREFISCETKEIRLFLYGGDDYIIIRGNVNSNPDIIVNAGRGDNEFIDSSVVNGYLAGLIPFIPRSENKTHLYTVNKKTRITAGPSTTISRFNEPDFTDQISKYEPPGQDYGHDWRLGQWFELNNDVGVFIGGGPILYEFGYNTAPYVYRMELKAGYANKGNKYKLLYLGEFNSFFKNIRLQIKALVSGLEVLNFYGTGNETKENPELETKEFYRVEQKQYIFNPAIELPLDDGITSDIGLELVFTDTDPRSNSFLFQYQPYGVNNVSLLGLRAGLTVLNVDHPVVPEKGYYANLYTSYYPEILKSKAAFGVISTDVRYYYPLGIVNSVIALKSTGEYIYGNYPFFKAAFLGGIGNLRGFERDRFSGDAAVSLNSELRTSIIDFNFIFPGRLGTIISAETGRVFVKGDKSKLWHTSYGGGLWLSLINKDLTFAFMAADSKEDLMLYLQFGFAY